MYADNIKYLSLMSNEEFGATIEAYTYPDEFAECDGSAELGTGVMIGQQTRKYFGLAYKTVIGNDIEGNAHGYKIHIIYGAQAAPSEKAYATINDSPEAITFSWELNTSPIEVTGFKPTASLVIDSTKIDAATLAHNPRQRLAVNGFGGGKDHRFDAVHPFAPAHLGRQMIEFPVKQLVSWSTFV